MDDLHVPAPRGQRRHHALVTLLDGRRHLALRQIRRLLNVVTVRRELGSGSAAPSVVRVARRQRSEMLTVLS